MRGTVPDPNQVTPIGLNGGRLAEALQDIIKEQDGIPTTRQIIEFSDRFMKNTAKFTGYDASEGALYVLFMLCLAMHPQAPSIFAIDSFDHALNPRPAKKITQVFCE